MRIDQKDLAATHDWTDSPIGAGVAFTSLPSALCSDLPRVGAKSNWGQPGGHTEATLFLLVVGDPQFSSRLEADHGRGGKHPALELRYSPNLGSALEKLRGRDPVNVVLVDLNLPDSQGWDTYTTIRAQAPRLPIIVLTEKEDEALVLEGIRCGAEDFLIKTECTRNILVRVIRYAMERGRAEEALRESHRRHRRLIASTTDYIYTVRCDLEGGSSTHHSDACMTLTGYSAGEFQADPRLWFRMVFEQDRPAVLEQIERVMEGLTPRPLEHRIRHKEGGIRWIKNTSVPHLDPTGRVTSYDGLICDITQRKRAEEALRESQERLSLVLRGSNDGIWDWNVTTGQVYFSPRWKAMLGYEDHEVQNVLGGWKGLLHPEDRAVVLEQIQAYFDGRAPSYEVQHRLRHKDGSYRWILARGVVLRDAEGKPVRMAGSHVDLTQRKHSEEQLKNALAETVRSEATLKQTVLELDASEKKLRATHLQLIQAAKMECIGTLAAGVAHEVKNPLQTILMGLAYLTNQTPPENAEIRLALDEMRSAVQRADSIIRELLQLSASARVELQENDLTQVLKASLLLMHYELLAAQTVVVLELTDDLPRVLLDKSKMEQVFVNLFLNACQAMLQGGTLTVRTWSEPWSSTSPLNDLLENLFKYGERVVIAQVQDTGIGIPERDLPRVFDAFFSTKPCGGGTGLGLSVVKSILDLHGGLIKVENVPEGGALVTLILKAKPN